MQIIGHRGARGEAPENTLGGFQYLSQLGIRAVEFDVRQLKDLSLVVIHDDNFQRTAGISAHLYDYDQTELTQFDQRIQWPAWPQSEYTPTLSQVLAEISNFEHIEVEIKAVPHQEAAETLVTSLIPNLAGFESQVTITSFDKKILTTLQQQHSAFKRGLLVEQNPEIAIESALELGCQRIGWMNQLATPQRIQDTHAAQLMSSVWTVNDPKRARELRELGVHGLITDLPKIMLQELQQ